MGANLAKRAQYILLYNSKPICDEKDKLYKASGAKIQNSFGEYQLDSRTESISVCNSLDLEQYFNYYEFYIGLLNELTLDINYKGPVVNHLDMGYVPVYVPPTFMTHENSTMLNYFRSKIYSVRLQDGRKLKTLEVEPVRLDGSRAAGLKTDIWVSRFSLAELLGTRPESIRMLSAFEKILE